MSWQKLIVGYGEADPLSLTPHAQNFRLHPMEQRKAVTGALNQLGFIDQVVVNKRTNHVINGHLRVELAIANGEASIPVAWIDVDVDKENLILATFDRIGEMAQPDEEKLRISLDKLMQAGENEHVLDLLTEWVGEFEEVAPIKVDMDIPTNPLLPPDEVPEGHIRFRIGPFLVDVPEADYRTWRARLNVECMGDPARIETEIRRRLRI